MSLAVQAAVHIGKRVYSCSLEVRVNNFALPKALLSGSAPLPSKARHWFNMLQSGMTVNHFLKFHRVEPEPRYSWVGFACQPF